MALDRNRIAFLNSMRDRVKLCQDVLELGGDPVPVMKELEKIERAVATEYCRNPRASTVWETGNGRMSRRGKAAIHRENMKRMDFGKRSPDFTEAT